MQKLCCVRTRQHSLPVWIISSQVHHRISTNSQPFSVGIVSLCCCSCCWVNFMMFEHLGDDTIIFSKASAAVLQHINCIVELFIVVCDGCRAALTVEIKLPLGNVYSGTYLRSWTLYRRSLITISNSNPLLSCFIVS